MTIDRTLLRNTRTNRRGWLSRRRYLYFLVGFSAGLIGVMPMMTSIVVTLIIHANGGILTTLLNR